MPPHARVLGSHALPDWATGIFIQQNMGQYLHLFLPTFEANGFSCLLRNCRA